MSKPLAFGLNLAKKPGQAKPPTKQRKPMFGGGDSSDEEDAKKKSNGTSSVLEIGGFDDFDTPSRVEREPESRKSKARPSKGAPLSQPPKLKTQAQSSTMFGDLSSSLTAKKNADAAEELDASVYEYDAVYDSLKPGKKVTAEDEERRPRYMKNLMQAAEVRNRDRLIAEEKKIAREREAEGEEFQDKEKFVTGAYKRQQEENRRLEEEEKKREEEEAKKNKDGGMQAFYRNMLDRGEQRHAEAVKAAEEAAKEAPKKKEEAEEDQTEEQAEAKRVKEMVEKGASIAVNEDGQVVDKRQLLKGGLNLSKKTSAAPVRKEAAKTDENAHRRHMSGLQMGSKQSMRERQSRMLAEQLEQSMKRSREASETAREETERAAKSRKTEGEISSAKERYLARKKAAEEAKAGGA